jgi:AcrR family transcriptional regulator
MNRSVCREIHVVAKNITKPSARERLLAAADELFYDEGIHTVGIDRVIEHAGVAKASLYNTFGSKEALVRAYLERRGANMTARITRHIARHDDPRQRLLAVYEALAEHSAETQYRGCAFYRACAETRPGDEAEAATTAYRVWLRGLLTDLARDAGVAEPEDLARKLHVLYDGAGVSVRLDRDQAAAGWAREAAESLLDAALAAGPARAVAASA